MDPPTDRTRLHASTAIVHDWFQGMHGAERLVDTMRSELFAPGAEPAVFTFYAARELLPDPLAKAIVGQSRAAGSRLFQQHAHGPGRWKYLLPLMPLYFRHLDLSEYELVLSSSHSFALHARARRGAFHVCYCHTPIRYAWLPAEEGDRQRGLAGHALSRGRSLIQAVDRLGARQPDAFIANSQAVRERIQRAYGRDAVVIHPPVDIDDFSFSAAKAPGHFLWVQRLVPHKRPELVAEAFRGLPYRLTMVGTGMLEDSLRASLPENVTLRAWIDRNELSRLFETTSGFLHVGEEDFGISMVEALAAGSPVIAVNAGGARDIVRPDVDGILLDDVRVETVREAVRQAAKQTWDAGALRARAETFSRQVFVHRMIDYLTSLGVA